MLAFLGAALAVSTALSLPVAAGLGAKAPASADALPLPPLLLAVPGVRHLGGRRRTTTPGAVSGAALPVQ